MFTQHATNDELTIGYMLMSVSDKCVYIFLNVYMISSKTIVKSKLTAKSFAIRRCFATWAESSCWLSCYDDRQCKCGWSLVTEQYCAVGPHKKVSRTTGSSTYAVLTAVTSSISSTKSSSIYTKAFRNPNAVSRSEVVREWMQCNILAAYVVRNWNLLF